MKHSVSISNKTIINSYGKLNSETEDWEKQIKANPTIIDYLAFNIILVMAFLENSRIIVDAEENMIYYKRIVKNEVFTLISLYSFLLLEL